MRQKRILLRLVEAVNFVDEHNGARAVLPGALGIGHHLLDFFNSGEHGGEFDELRLSHARDDLRQRGFSCTRRAPEDQRASIVSLQLRTQGFAGSYQVILAYEFVEASRTHAVGQRSCAVW